MKIIKTLIPTFKQSVNARYFEPMTSGDTYTALSNDIIAVKTEIYESIINLPTGTNNQSSVTITDHSGYSSVNNIQIFSDIEIEGGSLSGLSWTYTINSDYDTINLVKDVISNKWKIDGISSGSGLPTTKGFLYINNLGDAETIDNNSIGNDTGLLGFDSDALPTTIEIGDGLKTSILSGTTTLAANVGDGLQINSVNKKIEANIGDGLVFNAGAIDVSFPAASGDVSGTYPNLTVDKINNQTVNIDVGTLSDGQSLVWNSASSKWTNATVSGGGGGGGGAGFAYYLNYSTTAASPPVGAWKEMSLNPSNNPVVQTVTLTGVSTIPTSLAKFESPIGNPAVTILPGGDWNLNLYLSTTAPSGEAYFLFKIYKISGTTATLIVESSPENITNTSTTLYSSIISIPATTVTITDRIGIEILIGRYNTSSSYDVTGYFEGTNICYVQTSIGTPGGTGLLKTVGGVLQSPSSLLKDIDVDAAANIAGSKLQKATSSNFGAIQLNTANGDLSEDVTAGYAKVAKIQGISINSSPPINNEVFIYSSSGSEWSHKLITNDNVSSTAAISGSKITPNFGSQNIITTGNVNGAVVTASTSFNGSLKPGLTAGVVHSTGIANALTSSLILDADIDSNAAITGTKIKKAGTSQFGVIEFNSTGDLSQTSANSGIAKVTKIQGVAVSSSVPNSGDLLKYNGSGWAPGQIDAVTTLIYDPSIAADTGNIYKTWNSLIANIPRITYTGSLSPAPSYNSWDVLGNVLIILRNDVTLTSNLNLDHRIKIKGEFNFFGTSPNVKQRFPIIYTSSYWLNKPSELENISIVNNNSSTAFASYCFKHLNLTSDVISPEVVCSKLILRNCQLYSVPTSPASPYNRRFVEITDYVKLNIEMYGRSVIGGGNPASVSWTW